MFLFPNNLGTFVEQLMMNTAEYYRAEGIAYFRRASPNYIHLTKQSKRRECSSAFFGRGERENKTHQIRLCSKGDLDFYGVYRGKYFSLELKETRKESFSLSLLKKHQITQLEEIERCGGISLLLIHFSLEKSFFILLRYQELKDLIILKRKKSFNLNELLTVKSYELRIIYPHIFNLAEKLDQMIRELNIPSQPNFCGR